MPTGRMDVNEKKRWARLYELAEGLDRLCPWQWMGVSDCFGVSGTDGEEPCFVVFGGEPKGFRSVRLLRGWKALYELMSRLADSTRQEKTWLLEIRMVELLFVNQELLFDHELAFLRGMRRQPDTRYATPIFRSIRPGFHPWLPDEAERALAEAALFQALGMAMRVEADGMLLKSRFPREILVRQPDAAGSWRDVWTPAKEIVAEELEVRLDGARLTALRAQPVRDLTLQIDLVFTALRIMPDGRRPQTAYVLLVVDASSGMILTGDLLQATNGIPEMWAQIPDRLLQVFEEIGGCPQAIEVSAERMANLIRPLGEYLPFKLVRRARLEKLEDASENLSALLQRQASGKPPGADAP